MISKIAPPGDRDAGSLRQLRLIELLRAEGHDVTLVARDGAEDGQHDAALALEAMGVRVTLGDPVRSPLAQRAGRPELDLEGLLRDVRPDVVWLSFFDVAEAYLPLLRRWAPGARLLVDTVDVHWVREARAAEVAASPALADAAVRTRDREAAAYGAADGLIAVSEDDAAALRALAPEVPVAVISLVHPEEPEGPGPQAREGALFVGNFRHAPNVDAALFLVGEVWPRVRAVLPEARLTLAGGAPPPEVRALAGDGVEVTGWVPAIAPLLEAARVSVAPLRYGAGVKGKIGEAMAHGVPVVTTTIGAEGMGLVDGEHALVVDDPQGLADAIVALHCDDALWRAIGAAGRAGLEARLSPAVARRALRGLTASVPERYIAPHDLDDDGLRALLEDYVGRFPTDAPTSLVFPVDDDAEALLGRLLAALAAMGRDPEAIPDVAVTPWRRDAPAPRGAVLVDTPALPEPARAPAAAAGAPRAAVAVHLPDDPDAARLQLEALLASGAGADAELLALSADPVPAGVRHVALPRGAGRRLAQLRAVNATEADILIVLEPHALPRAGFAAPLIDAVEAGAALAGPAVDGALGLSVDPAGALWPLGGGERPAALPFDALAARRETWRAMPPHWPSREGHAERQLAGWVSDRGPVVAVAGAAVDRAAMPDCSVIICTRDRADIIEGCVEQVVGQGVAEIVVVDNGSTDATPDVLAALAERHPAVRVVDEPRAGLSIARNTGAHAASHELLIYLDDDARIAPGWAAALARELARDGVAIAGGPIVGLWPQERDPAWPAPRLEPFYGVLDHGDADLSLVAPKIVYGGNWGARRSVLLAAGGFDPELGVGPDARIGGEEVSVAWQVQRRGLGATRYVIAGAVGHLIPAARLNDDFLTRRSYTVGLERPRHLERPDRAQLLAHAGEAARRLLHHLPLAGSLSVEEAVEAIAAADVPSPRKTGAADGLGELVACLILAGEDGARLGDLALAVRPEQLAGVLARPAVAAA
ncbi:glycosyltransferase [Conexibacter woesei]|uniref:glycosyltransferase n=1 Tax=Conexibacter woesei TaxID=191495 RepID=UPI000687F28E|nr:glycosyltransferase [Conexibacter woesei]